MYNILVVDDDKEIVESIEIYLKNEGFNIFKAYNGIEALEILVEKEIHLILMDIMMPKLDGTRKTDGTDGTKKIYNNNTRRIK